MPSTNSALLTLAAAIPNMLKNWTKELRAAPLLAKLSQAACAYYVARYLFISAKYQDWDFSFDDYWIVSSYIIIAFNFHARSLGNFVLCVVILAYWGFMYYEDYVSHPDNYGNVYFQGINFFGVFVRNAFHVWLVSYGYYLWKTADPKGPRTNTSG